jgi:hypothetical protein
MGEKLMDTFNELAEKIDYIRKNKDKEFKGKVMYADPNGKYYHVEITDDGILNGTVIFSSYGDLKDYQDVLNAALQKRIQIPTDGVTTGAKFSIGDEVKFKLAFDLRGIDVEQRG